ncbi:MULTISPECIES: ion channel [unclassified Arthrobacter]|uniref:ion channel n=1 Tax=unclassified Arthrobacter TaxID=235627 RepID=UPI000CE474D7|nr:MULTISPECIES: ion channel [unclassified Arthrobacter]
MTSDGSALEAIEGPAGRSRSILRSGYWLVLLLIAVSYALCAAQGTADPNAVALLVQLATVAVTLWVAEVKTGLRRAGWIIVLVAGVAVALVAVVGTAGHLLDVLFSGASIVAYLVAPVAIIAREARKTRVDGQTLLAAIAVYILVGMLFTFIYNFIALVSSVPTFNDGQLDSLSSQLFFSFTTLTTTGYGDKVPAGAGVQSVAIMEAITGQLFLVIALARVVAGWKPATAR